ncbi:MAG: T9SS C-terminal target domain-containing protein [Bacteroidetes bacterium]|nr:MAG: T9SS C-terminal target domain-containing protein [Bacteroidota bacterium]
MYAYRLFLLFLILFLGPLKPGFSQDVELDSTRLTARDVATGLQVPWEVKYGPDDHLWVTERRGRILRIEPESGNMTTVLNYEEEVLERNSEYGMLGMALHPDFLESPQLFVVYCYAAGGQRIRERLSRFDWNGAELVNETILLDDIPGGGIHNGSRLLFTDDGKLLMTVGDRGSRNSSQALDQLNGKVLRMNIDGTIPADNPDPASYIYSFGHRNQQGLAYGPNRHIYASEHGQNIADELNMILPARNYGWPSVEGACNTASERTFCATNNVAEPLMEWTPCVAVNDIVYYNHPAIPEWEGKMLMAVLGGFIGDPRISVLSFNEDGTAVIDEAPYLTNLGRLRDVAINPHTGAIYVATNGSSYPGFGPNRIIEYRNLAYQPSTGEEISRPRFRLEVVPNPAYAQLQLQVSPNLMDSDYAVINAKGELVEEGKIAHSQQHIDVQSWPAGMYFVRLIHEQGLLTRTFVVE